MQLDIKWIVGFTDGEGCFHVALNKNQSMPLKIQLLAEFTITQHEREIETLNKIKEYFNCGVVRKNHGDCLCYRVRGQKNLTEIIKPFFEPINHHKKNRFWKVFRVCYLD